MTAFAGVHQQVAASAIAPISPPTPSATLVADSSFVSSPVPAGYSRYTRSGQYSIEFPDGAYITDLGSDYLIMTNYALRSGGCCFQPGDLKTDVSIQPMPFETAARNSTMTPGEMGGGGQILRQESLTLDGRDALRTWDMGGDNGADAVSTIVKLSDTETLFITSFSATGDDSMHNAIETIHNSVQALN
ncbi:MAG: hypothetical protein AAF152_08140 [Cyanobacteria bacterium P01_A01_bin.114]